MRVKKIHIIKVTDNEYVNTMLCGVGRTHDVEFLRSDMVYNPKANPIICKNCARCLK